MIPISLFTQFFLDVFPESSFFIHYLHYEVFRSNLGKNEPPQLWYYLAMFAGLLLPITYILEVRVYSFHSHNSSPYLYIIAAKYVNYYRRSGLPSIHNPNLPF